MKKNAMTLIAVVILMAVAVSGVWYLWNSPATHPGALATIITRYRSRTAARVSR